MSDRLHLRVTTPATVLVDSDDIAAMRAEDASGSFGLLPGHADLLTVLEPSVLRWRDGDGMLRYCAHSGGVMTVTNGRDVAIACREGVIGTDLDRLREDVLRMREANLDADRRTRVEDTRMHARAVRQLMRQLEEPAEDWTRAP